MTKTAKTKIRSLSQIDPAVRADKGFEFEIVDTSTGEGVGMFITVTGQDGAAYQGMARKQLNAQLASGEQPKTIEKMVEQTIDTCVACTKAWRGVVIDEKEGELEFSEVNARRLYALRFVRDQAIKAIEDRANFTGG